MTAGLRYLFPLLVGVLTVSISGIQGKAGHAASASLDVDAIVPVREIRSTAPEVPLWKERWDAAREHLRAKEYEQAARVFDDLFKLKPNLYEARTEYTAMLMEMGLWKEAETSNYILLAHEPERLEHQLAHAKIALQTDRLALAVNLFSELYVHNPTGKRGDDALEGLVQSLKLQGKADMAVPLMEQLLVRKPDDALIRREAGLLFLGAGVFDRAYALLREGYPAFRQDQDVLVALAQALEGLGRKDEAGSYWQEIIALDHGNIQANRALISYYENFNNPSMQLRHLAVLEEKNLLTTDESLQMIQIYLATGRSDLALEKSTSSLKHDEDNVHFIQLRQQALSALANELLVLVEHDNAGRLWEDLSGVTGSRLDVFAVMADELRKKGKWAELTDVLMIMAGEMPDNHQVWSELEELLKSQGRMRELAALSGNRIKESGQSVN